MKGPRKLQLRIRFCERYLFKYLFLVFIRGTTTVNNKMCFMTKSAITKFVQECTRVNRTHEHRSKEVIILGIPRNEIQHVNDISTR